MNKFNILSIATLCAIALCCGCKTMEFNGPNWINQDERPRLLSPINFGGKSKEDTVGIAQKMAVIWKETVMQKPGSPNTRGFGGRVYFYDAENKAVKVDGEMIVYGFDADAERTEADKKFVFRSEELQGHYGETDLGHSYSFWVPWDKNGSPRMAVSLIPIFKNSNGKIVKGGQTINVLPGPPPKNQTESSRPQRSGTFIGKDAVAENAEIKLTSGEAPAGTVTQNGIVQEDRSTRIRTTTISLPKHISDRIANAPVSTGPMNTVRTSQRNIGIEDTTVDLRNQTKMEPKPESEPETKPESQHVSEQPAEKSREKPSRIQRTPAYPAFGGADPKGHDAMNDSQIRVFGKPQPFH